MRLVGEPEAPRLLTTRTGVDHTERMLAWAADRVRELEGEDLCGFIFKKDSPSSGMTRVKVYNSNGMAVRKGIGLFARTFMDRFPRLPVEDEGRLHDADLRNNFIERIFALRRWRTLLGTTRKIGALIDFHAHEKLLVMAHSPEHYRQMGRLVGTGRQLNPEILYETYERLFMQALLRKCTPAKNINVLQHILGYFKTQLSPDEKQEMLEIFARYRNGDVPLIVPITIANHYVRKYEQAYLAGQTYLNPHPIDLQLRNQV